MSDTKVKDELEFEVDDELVGRIADSVAPRIQDSLRSTIEDTVKSSMESIKKKNVDGGTSEKKDSVDKTRDVKSPFEKMSKEMRLLKGVAAYKSHDYNAVREINDYNMHLRAKAGYANTDTDGEGGYLVPDPEFDTTVHDNLPNFGVAFSDADVRQTDRTAVRLLSLNDEIQFVETNEAEAKTSRKLDFSRKTVDLRKFAMIVPSTDELVEDAAIDFWNLVTRETSRALARKADEITFTDATSGITNTTGIITTPIGSGSVPTWNELLTSEGKLEDTETSGHAWYMRKELWYQMVQQRADAVTADDEAGTYLFQPNPSNPTTPWGTRVRFTRVLPNSVTVGDNDALAVYGNLSNYRIYQKRGLQLTTLTEATIKDADDSDFNLATQDATALRAVARMLGIVADANASKFVVVGKGTVS